MPRRTFTPPPPRKVIKPRVPIPQAAQDLFAVGDDSPMDAEEPPLSEHVVSLEPDTAPVEHRDAQGPQESPEPPPAPQTPQWIVQAREVDLLVVAREIGIDLVPRTDKPGFMLAPCPACGDAAGAKVFINRRWNVIQWACPECGERGGSLDLASLCLMGARLGQLDDEGHAAVRGWFSAMGWCEGD